MASTKVTLVNANLVQRPAVAPIALDIIATSLDYQGFDVSILDLTPRALDFEKAIGEFFARNNPDYVGISFRNSWDMYLPSIEALSEQGSFIPSHRRIIDALATRFPREKIIAGGVGFSFMPEVMLERLDLNQGVVGAGEMILPEIINKMEARASLDDIPFAVQKGRQGYKNGRMSAFPGTINRKNFVDNDRYYTFGEHVGIRTNNGCTKSCIFCPEKTVKGSLFRHDLGNVLEEMDQLVELGVKDIHLNDSEMNMPFGFSKQFAKAIIERKYPLDIRFWSYMQPKPFDDEYARLWRKAGMIGIDFGTDHTDAQMLKKLGKGWYGPEDIAKTTKICNENGIAVMHELLFGMYGETMDSIKKSIDFIWSLNPHVIGTTLGVGVTPKSLLAINQRVLTAIAENDIGARARQGLYCKGTPLEDPTYIVDPSISIPEAYDQMKAHIGEREARIMIPTLDSISAPNNQLVNSKRIDNVRENELKGAHWYHFPRQFEKTRTERL
ncbi:MAG TPA: radical SAM protein [Candidatus Nanoarchaeia archaeon]|nr:radical SAM protein [Candidatus Nanoarchaeia archaeon]